MSSRRSSFVRVRSMLFGKPRPLSPTLSPSGEGANALRIVMNIEAGTLFVVAAPSGAGKSSLVNALLEREPTISLSISHTTRPPRVGELYGRHYYFVDRDAFEKQVAEG